jgi:flavin-binding protein dodecin
MEDAMSEHVYKLTEIVGTSHEGNEAAIRVALERASKSLRNIRWFEVVAQRGYVADDGQIVYQVTLKVGFTLED